MSNKPKLRIEDAKIIFPFSNFSGVPRKGDTFHREGDRDLCVQIDEELAGVLQADGWNIKRTKTREDGTGNDPYIKIKINYNNEFKKPTVAIVKERGLEYLDENTVGCLDHLEVLRSDISIDPHPWEFRGEKGVNGYLDALYVRVNEDIFAEKWKNGYADVTDAVDEDSNPF